MTDLPGWPVHTEALPLHTGERAYESKEESTAHYDPVLEAPAGSCDVAGEAPETTARRELAEEAGLLAESMEVLMGTFPTPGISDQHTTIFLATGLSPCPTDRMGVEEGFMTVETVPLDDVEALVAEGTLVDETTVLGMLLARAHLAR